MIVEKGKIIRHSGDKGGYYKIEGNHDIIISKKIKLPKDPVVYFDLQGSKIIVEDNVSFSEGVIVFTHSHYFEKSNWRDLPIIRVSNPTIFREKSYIGTNAIILDTCKYIGVSSVIGTGSVVTKNVPDYEIWAGNPAKKIGDVEK